MEVQQLNTSAELRSYVEAVRPGVEAALKRYLPCAPEGVGTRFNEALYDAVFPGGKRWRPVLVLLGAELVGGARASVLTAAAAVEFIHSSSLIFDDLPCMDNALKRRGRAALHLRYTEGLSVLVALALMNSAYGLIFNNETADRANAVRAHQEFVNCIGTAGMVVGQTVDLFRQADHEELERTRNLKTSALMRMSLRVGAILSGANADQLQALSHFAELLGTAYQMRDDVLDLEEDKELSHAAGSNRTTLALKHGAEDATRRLGALVAEAKDVLATTPFTHQPSAKLLGDLAAYIATRSN